MSDQARDFRPPSAQPLFLTTRWSIILSACDKESPASDEALATLCRIYWYPLYAYVRRRGHSPHDAQDLTQSFFERLLEKDYLRSVAPENGRFRAFLVVAMKHFLANERDKARTLKRGGGVTHLALDSGPAESRYGEEPAERLPADQIFERRWALTLLDRAMARLRSDYEQSGRIEEFHCLKTFLTAARGEVSYREISARLGLNEGAARVALHRLRKRFRQLFRDEIAETVSDPTEIDDEMRHIVSVLGRD